MSGYCAISPGHPIHETYHASEHGFPSRDESVLFERLCMEIMQAGLSWSLVLQRRATMRIAFTGYDVDAVAAYGEADVTRLMADPGIVRNRLKILAIIHNAGVIKALRTSHGGFAAWLDAHHPLDKPEWVRLFKRQFRFTGGEITGEFLMSLGWLPDAHSPDCPIYPRITALLPPWNRA
jgi:DNA-3-methyladenine glycosylase I